LDSVGRYRRGTAESAAAQWSARHLGKRAPGATFQGTADRVGAGGWTGASVLNLPNLITVARILIVPVVVWAIAQRQMQIAFLLFLAAGVSDAVDGFLAKRFGMASELGAHLDPLADKALVVSIYVAFGITEALPRWLVILVVSRDILIVGGVMFAWFLGKPMKVKPLLVSKLNTGAQIVLALLVLAALAFGFDGPAEQVAQTALMWLVAALTLLSVGIYTRDWWRHMNAGEADA
jgi:cardiolipin synthase (CMP-forming)